jgi:hypothetical protein
VTAKDEAKRGTSRLVHAPVVARRCDWEGHNRVAKTRPIGAKAYRRLTRKS